MIKIMQSEFEQQINGEEMNQIVLYDNLNNTYHIDQAERFNALGFNQFTDWTCNAGYQSVIIMGNEVKRGYSCRDLPIGTLEKFDLRIKPPKCVTPKCVSSADSKIPKCKIK
jgi:hypothetical protein